MKYLFVILLFFSVVVNAQSKKTHEITGDKLYEMSDFYGASIAYQKAIAMDSLDLDLQYKYALSLKAYNNYNEAFKAFEKVQSMDTEGQYLDCLFWMAVLEKNRGNYVSAAEKFKAFTKIYKDKSAYIYHHARNEVKSVKYIERLLLDTLDYEINSLGNKVNSSSAEFSPVLKNDSTMYYSSLRSKNIDHQGIIKDADYFIKIYEAQRIDSVWQDIGMVEGLSQGGHNANGSFNEDGTAYYFSRCSDLNQCQIMVTKWDSSKWSSPVPLGEDVNLPGSNNTQPCYAVVGGKSVLFFSSNREKSKGNMDLWVCEMKGGVFTKPKNLGPKINSKGNEIAPYFDVNNNLLYFSSDWHYGLGGFDIFKATGTSYKSYSKIENIGIPINSSVNDLYFIPNGEEHGYFASNRKGTIVDEGEALCCNDLFEFQLPEPIDTTTTEEPEQIIQEILKQAPVVLYFHNDRPNPRTTDTITNLTYSETYVQYKEMLNTYKEKYSEGLEGEDKEDAIEEIEDFFSAYVDKGIEDLEKFSELLITQLEKGHSIELTVKGYASPLAKSDYNVNLTLRRISSMENYLRSYKNGIYIPYLEGTAENKATLKIKKIPFGEYKSSSIVSDNLEDKKNSVYSKSAALERKIEIISLKLIETEDSVTVSIPNIILKEQQEKYGITLEKLSDSDSISVVISITREVEFPWLISNIEKDEALEFSHKMHEGNRVILNMTFNHQEPTNEIFELILFTDDKKQFILRFKLEEDQEN